MLVRNFTEKFNDNKVTCLSVLTEEEFFLGSLDHISKIKSKMLLFIFWIAASPEVTGAIANSL